MAWEERENGSRYFYWSQRQPDGSVYRQYLGNGMRAEVEAIRIESKQIRQMKLVRERRLTTDLEKNTRQSANSITALMEAHYFAAGLHNPKGRGWRRRNKMIKSAEAEMEENMPSETESQNEISKSDLEGLVSLARRGDSNAARQLRTILNEEPDIFGSLGQMAVKIQQKWIQTIAGQDLFEKEMILRATMELRKSLIEEGDRSELERLAIEQVISSYLQLSYHEDREAKSPASDLKIADHRANQIERASRRHMKALGALTTLRLLAPKMKGQKHCACPPRGSQDARIGYEHPHSNGNRLASAFDSSHQPVPMN